MSYPARMGRYSSAGPAESDQFPDERHGGRAPRRLRQLLSGMCGRAQAREKCRAVQQVAVDNRSRVQYFFTMAKVTHLTLAKDGEFTGRHIQLDEIIGDGEAPLQTIGQDLRAARVRRGEDLATASRTLKIRMDHLEALEDDRLTALPGRTYAVGFVRAYADYLGLNPLRAVERFRTEIAGREDTVKNAGFPEVEEQTRLPGGWFVIGTLVLGLIA